MDTLFQCCHDAINRGAVDELRSLLKGKRTDMREGEEHGRTLLMFAVSPLAAIEPQSSIEIVRMLLDAGADPNQRDAEGRTAVHFAAAEGPEILQMILAAGGDPNASDERGNTPLSTAVLSGRRRVPCAKLLLNTGADPTKRNRCGNSALDIVKKMGTKELLTLFNLNSKTG